MKKILTFLLLFISLFSFSQNQDTTIKKESKTALARADLKIGAVIKKEFIDIFSVSGKGFFNYLTLQVQILNIIDASTLQTFSGLKISNLTGSAFLDLDEVPALLKFIELLNVNAIVKPENYTEYIFNSNDLQVYTYFSNELSNKKSPTFWHYGIETDKYNSSKRGELELKVLNEMKEAIIKSKFKFSIVPNF